MNGVACSSCRWWYSRPGWGNGQCRRNPPTLPDPGQSFGRWPATGQDDWCAEWRPEPVEPVGSVEPVEPEGEGAA